jgi:hypothetical protein
MVIIYPKNTINGTRLNQENEHILNLAFSLDISKMKLD